MARARNIEDLVDVECQYVVLCIIGHYDPDDMVSPVLWAGEELATQNVVSVEV
jgi:hypothetical protein